VILICGGRELPTECFFLQLDAFIVRYAGEMVLKDSGIRVLCRVHCNGCLR